MNGLLTLTCSPEAAVKALASFNWDSQELVQLRPEHVLGALRGYLAGEYTASNLERWAEIIEGRDDIGFEPPYEEALKATIFELASPELEGPLTRERASELLATFEVRYG